MHSLLKIEKSIRELEEHHNDVLDVSQATNENIQSLAEELYQEADRITEQITYLREQVRKRIEKAKRATVIMSLLAQEEELKPVRNRIDQQPYELYATSEWFKKQLSEQP